MRLYLFMRVGVYIMSVRQIGRTKVPCIFESGTVVRGFFFSSSSFVFPRVDIIGVCIERFVGVIDKG